MSNLCKHCGSVLVQTRKDHIKKFCNTKCANTYRARTSPSPFSNPEVQNKVKETLKKKYGVDNPWKSRDIQEKIASKKNYKEIVKKTVATTKKLHGEDFYRNKWKSYNQRNIPKEVLEKLESKEFLTRQHEEYSLSEIARQLNVSVTMVWEYSRKHGIDTRHHTTSTLEHTIRDFLDEHKIDYVQNDRFILDGKEIDFLIPSKQIGIELHGVYWHSEKFHDKLHLRKKYELAQTKGIDLIQFTECDIIEKFDIVKSMILSRLNIYQEKVFARKCSIQKITDQKQLSDFYNQNHIQSYVPCSINIGLFHNNDMISCMSFSKARFGKCEYELMRFANKRNYCVIGAASKLFKHFLTDYQPSSIVSYSDMQYFTGSLYERLGFLKTHETQPTYSYVAGNRLLSRMNFQKKTILKKFPEADMSLTEEVLVQKYFNYLRFYHVGHRVHIWENT